MSERQWNKSSQNLNYEENLQKTNNYQMKTPGGLSGSDNTSRMNNLVRTQIPSSNEPGEGIDHYKKLFSFSK